MSFRSFLYISFCLPLLLAAGCKDDDYALPTPQGGLQNDAIKRTLGPNVIGLNIEFAYAMAILPEQGKLVSAQAEASIAGATGTYLEHRSFFTDPNGGIDTGVPVAEPSTTNGATTSVTFNKDTSAATLRYFYRIPEEARGKTVNFTFSAKSSNGESVSLSMGPYTISKMDMKLDMAATDAAACYISIEDMAIYTAAEAAANPEKIDLVYLYRTPAGLTFNHALVAPAADPQYLPGVTLPAGVDRNTKIIKTWALRDRHLARLEFGIYIDDPDFEQKSFTDAPNFAINLKKEAGAWVETADGKYRAYIFINNVNNGSKTATISMKRYTMQ